MTWRVPVSPLATVVPLLAGCEGLLDLDVRYERCVEPSSPYQEEFRGGRKDLLDKCWQIQNVRAGDSDAQRLFVDDGDLVIHLGDYGAWTDAEQAPALLRRIDGDFVFAARVEALGKVNADHCIPDSNFASVVLRSPDDATVWATVELGPYFADEARRDEQCVDEAPDPPTARARVRAGSGLATDGAAPRFSLDDIGDDGEADLAVCRQESVVAYYYRDHREADPINAWKQIPGPARYTLPAGAVEVGLSAAVVAPQDPDAGGAPPEFLVAAHFNWIVVKAGLGGDGCSGALDALPVPKGD